MCGRMKRMQQDVGLQTCHERAGMQETKYTTILPLPKYKFLHLPQFRWMLLPPRGLLSTIVGKSGMKF